MPFELFRIRLVDLFDQVIELLETEGNGFESFHADGHVLLVDDYLEIRPEQQARLERLVAAGKLLIGPWYVLQDAFLTSGEAQVRNMLIGIGRARQLGGATMIGYFPDTFGNISQSAQLLQGFDIRHAVFGRGINPVAENNRVLNEGNNGYQSEVWWSSPDGSEVLSAFLANWYHNGFELPTDREEAQRRIKVMIPNVEKFAGTKQLLLMNGCDHQPVQKDVGQAIERMNELLTEEYRVVHGNFPDYFARLEPEARDADLRRVAGELTGQRTEGWGLLINTASSRLYLKQWNAKVQRELERWSEPFAVIAGQFGMPYPDRFLQYAWKQLLLNHPHDSICGCSLDEVHREMETRFEKALQVAEAWTDKALSYVARRVPVPSAEAQAAPDDIADGYAIAVFNPLERTRGFWVETNVDAEEPLNLDRLAWFNAEGDVIPIRAQVFDLGWVHGFTLPDDKFRIPWKKRRYRVRFRAEQVPAMGYASYYWLLDRGVRQEGKSGLQTVAAGSESGEWKMENSRLRLTVREHGEISLLDKRSGKVYTDLLVLEDSGDIGNEYNYVQAEEEERPRTNAGLGLTVEDCSVAGEQRLRLRQQWQLPLQRAGRQRSVEEMEHDFEWLLKLQDTGNSVEVELKWVNKSSDHRLRVLVPTDLAVTEVFADTPFDWTARDIQPWEGWLNPCRAERMQSRVGLQGATDCMMIVTDGLPEYEVLRDGRNTLAITLLRCIGELGDWNYFPTPEAQQLGRSQSVRFALVLDGDEKFDAFNEADSLLYPARAVAVPIRELERSEAPARYSMVSLDHSPSSLRLSTLKKAEDSADLVLRVVNLSERANNAEYLLNGLTGRPDVHKSRLDESVQSPALAIDGDTFHRWTDVIEAKQIATYLIRLSAWTEASEA